MGKYDPKLHLIEKYLKEIQTTSYEHRKDFDTDEYVSFKELADSISSFEIYLVKKAKESQKALIKAVSRHKPFGFKKAKMSSDGSTYVLEIIGKYGSVKTEFELDGDDIFVKKAVKSGSEIKETRLSASYIWKHFDLLKDEIREWIVLDQALLSKNEVLDQIPLASQTAEYVYTFVECGYQIVEVALADDAQIQIRISKNFDKGYAFDCNSYNLQKYFDEKLEVFLKENYVLFEELNSFLQTIVNEKRSRSRKLEISVSELVCEIL